MTPDCFCSVNNLCYSRCTAKATNAPCSSVQLQVLIPEIEASATLWGSFARQWTTQHSAACDDLPGRTALAVTNAGNLWHLVADKEEKRSEKKTKKTRCSYFSLMMLLCAWKPKPKYLSHNSYLVLGRQHYCSAGGRVNAYLAHRESGVLLRNSSL